jgi:deoxyribodipyrimidine photo-lyase
MIEKRRMQILNDKKIRNGKYVVYWMQASQRSEYNHALEFAIAQANELHKPLLVYFGLTDRYPLASERQYAFILEGLKETRDALYERGIKMIVRRESPETGAVEIARNACLMIVDRGYTRIQRYWRAIAAGMLSCPLIQVETNVIAPIEDVSDKEEYSAATIRGKIWAELKEYLTPMKKTRLKVDSTNLRPESFDIDDINKALSRLDINRKIKRVERFPGGTKKAVKLLQEFIDRKLNTYDKNKSDPTIDGVSHLSPYLHFGQISPLHIALQIVQKKGEGAQAFLEELIVRRELSMNFVFFNKHYDSFECLPDWCRATLNDHKGDRREYVYDMERLEKGITHDPYWNAAQKEMVYLGKMHGYMRMYWGKKILEWSESPETAYKTALYLNDKYELDGGDANGYAGVAWCFGKHDRPWSERPIFGKVRYMNAEGLRRKFDADGYVKLVEEKCLKIGS